MINLFKSMRMKYMSKRSKRNLSPRDKGVTLIELLVVIVIIGVLGAFFINTSGANLKRGRDARRKSDLELIRTGLETYRSDCDTYPANITFGGSLVGDGSRPGCSTNNTYISAIPTDPTSGVSYLYSSSGNTYTICAALETGRGVVACGGSTNCGTAICNYQVMSP